MLRDNVCGGKCLSFAQPEAGMQVIITCLLLVMKHRVAVASSPLPHRTQESSSQFPRGTEQSQISLQANPRWSTTSSLVTSSLATFLLCIITSCKQLRVGSSELAVCDKRKRNSKWEGNSVAAQAKELMDCKNCLYTSGSGLAHICPWPYSLQNQSYRFKVRW